MDFISLEEARVVGLKHYFTGKPCKYGHIEQRLVSTRTCIQCNRQAVLQWSKGLNARKTRLTTERRRRQIAREAGLKYYFTGKPCKRGHIDKRFVSSFMCVTCGREKASEAFRNLTGDKREAKREYERQRWQDPTFRKRSREYQRQPLELQKQRARNSKWKKANRASCTDRQNKRHAAMLAVFVEDVSLAFLFERDKGICQLCGYELSMKTKWPHPRTPTRDHVVPLTKEGTHERSNMQLACAVCNIAKSNRIIQVTA